jgi:hypothetical protein
MPNIQYRPLVWDLPRTPWNQLRDRNTFKQTWTQIQDLLDKELRQVDATEVTLELDVTEGAIKLDGGLRAGAGPGYQGIRVSFNLKDVGRVFFATDKHELWQHNVYAIARALEALRLVERYGINRGNEQYTGFKAITSNGSTSAAGAEAFIRGASGLGSEASIRAHLKAATMKLHPDQGGRRELWDALTDAKKVLGL